MTKKGLLYQPHKSSLGGLDANIMALLCYLATGIIAWIPYVQYIAWLAPLVLYFLEKESPLVRFHAMQAFVIQAVVQAVNIVLSVLITILAPFWAADAVSFMFGLGGGIFSIIIFLIHLIILAFQIAALAFEIIAIIKAYQYVAYPIPVIGGIAEKAAAKMPNNIS